VLLTREPGGTVVGTALRSIVLDPGPERCPRAPRRSSTPRTRPSTSTRWCFPRCWPGRWCLTDRYVDSTLAYQGAGRALTATELEPVARWATRDLRPQLTVLLDVDPRTGTTRFVGRDRLEAEPLDFHDAVRDSRIPDWPLTTRTIWSSPRRRPRSSPQHRDSGGALLQARSR
jgi:dTMP kinase